MKGSYTGKEIRDSVENSLKRYNTITFRQGEYNFIVERGTLSFNGKREEVWKDGYAGWCGKHGFVLIEPDYFAELDCSAKADEIVYTEFSLKPNKKYVADIDDVDIVVEE